MTPTEVGAYAAAVFGAWATVREVQHQRRKRRLTLSLGSGGEESDGALAITRREWEALVQTVADLKKTVDADHIELRHVIEERRELSDKFDAFTGNVNSRLDEVSGTLQFIRGVLTGRQPRAPQT